MPALPPVPNVVKTIIGQTLGEDSNVTTRLYWIYSGTTSDSIMTEFALDVATVWTTYIEVHCAAEHALVSVSAEDLTSSIAPIGSWAGDNVGSGSGTCVPAGVSMVVKHLIARRYRGGKPKTFLAGQSDSALADQQTWAGGAIATMANDWGNFVAEVISGAPGAMGTVNLVNVSYYEGFLAVQNPITGRWRNVPTVRTDPLIDQITGHLIDAKIGSQRRRYLLDR